MVAEFEISYINYQFRFRVGREALQIDEKLVICHESKEYVEGKWLLVQGKRGEMIGERRR